MAEAEKKEITPKELFIQKAREKMKLTVREFVYIPNESEQREKQRIKLDTKEKQSTVIILILNIFN